MSDVQIYPLNTFLDEANTEPPANSICVGIDLGTTYSLLAVVDSNYIDFDKSLSIPVQFAKVEQHSPFEYDQIIEDEKVASIVAVHNGQVYVGNNLYHLKGAPGFELNKNIFYHWKVEMGIDHHPMYPNAVHHRLDMPYKIAGGIINYIRKSYVGSSDLELPNTVITVPASFQVNQRKDVMKAAKMAKVKIEPQMLLDEPNAAFLGFFNRLSNEEKREWAGRVRDKNVLVIDYGGGTLDLSILNVDFKRETGIALSNKAISRYNDLGGQDLDLLIAEEVLIPHVKTVFPEFDSIDFARISENIIPQLCVIAEGLKVALCNKLSLKSGDKDVSEIDYQEIAVTRKNSFLEFDDSSFDFSALELKGKKFEELFRKFFRGKSYKFKYVDKQITTISTSITEIVEKADLTLNSIDFALLVGGSSLNPFLSSFCSEKLQASEILTSPEPDKLVAEGAAVYSYFKNTHGVSLIKPITSETIGVRLKGNRFYPLIEKGTTLPQTLTIPDFKIQSNLNMEVIVPICINGVDFPIGELKCQLRSFYNSEAIVKILVSINEDKLLGAKVYVEDDLIGEAEFENPFAIGNYTPEQRELHNMQAKVNEARSTKDTKSEKNLLRQLIWKHSEVKNPIGVIQTAEEYIKRFDDQNDSVWNMLHIGNDGLGRKKAALHALKRAIELSPESGAWHYNYSLILEKNDPQEALNYLENLSEDIKKDPNVACKLILLRQAVGKHCLLEAKKMVERYRKEPALFSDFEKRVLLPGVFEIAGEPFSYVSPKDKKRQENESKYLDTNNLPF